MISKDELILMLRKHQYSCDLAIDEAIKTKMQCAVNWSNLKCNNAQYAIDLHGEEEIILTIDEADPDNQEFHDFIYDKMCSLTGDKNFHIVTEW